MQSFPPYNQIDNPAASKSKLNSLLIILIITFFASGAALIILKQIDTYHRNQLYIAEQAALPIHKEVKASNYLESAWVLEGKNLKLPNFNNLSLNLPDGWYLAQPEIQSTQQGNVVFSALVCNFTDCGNVDKDKTPAGFSSFRIVVAPEYSEYRDEDIAQYADSKTNFKLKNGSAVFYEITKPKKNIEDLILPVFSALAMSEGKQFAKNYDVILTQSTRSALENTNALKAAMLYTLKSVQFGQDTSKNEAWKTYKNEEYGFSFEYPESWGALNNDGTNYLNFGCPQVAYGGSAGCPLFFISSPKVDQNGKVISSQAIFDIYKNSGAEDLNSKVINYTYKQDKEVEKASFVVKSDYPGDKAFEIICNKSYCTVFEDTTMMYWGKPIWNQIISSVKFTK